MGMAKTDHDGLLQEARVIGVGVGKEQKGILALKWALENVVPPQGSIHLLHVRSPLRWIPNPLGGKLPVDQVNPELVKQFKQDRLLDTKKLIDGYRKICEKKKVTSKLCYAENDSVPKELVDQISKLGITHLVLEFSTSSFLKIRKTESISAYVAKFAPEFCAVMVVRKGKLYSVKDATQSSSFQCTSRSISVASDLSISMASEIVEDNSLMASGSIQDEGRGIQPDAKVDLYGTSSHGRLQQSVSRDITQISPEWHTPQYGDRGSYQSPAERSVMMRNYSTPSQNRLFESLPATSFHQQTSSPHSSSNSQSIGGFEIQTSLASDFGLSEEAFFESQTSLASDFGLSEEAFFEINCQLTTPTRLSLDNLDCSPNTPIANEGLFRTSNSPDCETHCQTSMDIRHSTSSHILEGSPDQMSLMGSNTEIDSNKGLPTFEVDFLQSQLNEAKQSVHWVQRQAERQAINVRMAEEVVANARKMIEEHERHRDEALNEAKSALQKASYYEKRCEEAVAGVQVALRDQEILQTRLAEEVRRHQETQSELGKVQSELVTQKRIVDACAIEVELAKEEAQEEKSRCDEALRQLEEVTKALEEECQLRKEAEQRAAQEAISKREALLALRKEHQKYTEYSFEDLQLATNNFHEENKLGQGGYGPVYKGKMHHTMVAIKVLAREGPQGHEEFQKEVEVLSSIHHPHMVMLLGACPEKGCIVYEYMANGSLEDRLNCRGGTPPLPWYVRFRICLEVATALLFLHSRPQPIVHRDLKPGNILLDHHFASKISDVGLAKLVPNNLTFSITMYKETVIVGTLAYMDPDYQRTGVVSCESDVYSLGIIMLQLLTGRQAVGVVDLVEDAVDSNKLDDVLDKSAGEWPITEALALACLSLQCAEPRRKNRPNLETTVLPHLESIQGVIGIAAASMAHVGPSSSGTVPLIPSSFFCPISQEIMENPHLAADGFTYENDNIRIWLQDHDTSPMTNLVLSHKNLTPNYSLRSAIKEWYDNGLIVH